MRKAVDFTASPSYRQPAAKLTSLPHMDYGSSLCPMDARRGGPDKPVFVEPDSSYAPVHGCSCGLQPPVGTPR